MKFQKGDLIISKTLVRDDHAEEYVWRVVGYYRGELLAEEAAAGQLAAADGTLACVRDASDYQIYVPEPKPDELFRLKGSGRGARRDEVRLKVRFVKDGIVVSEVVTFAGEPGLCACAVEEFANRYERA